MVVAMDEGLRAEACRAAARLRNAGRRVDIVLEPKKMKWIFKQAARWDPTCQHAKDAHRLRQLLRLK